MLICREDGQLLYSAAGDKPVAVSVKQCFPWSDPYKFLSLRNGEDEELLMVEDLDELSRSDREAMLQALSDEEFCFDVEEIVEIVEEYELRNWLVKTKQGERRFQTRLQDWPQNLPEGRIVIRDLHGDIYVVCSVEKLSVKSQKLLWAFK